MEKRREMQKFGGGEKSYDSVFTRNKISGV